MSEKGKIFLVDIANWNNTFLTTIFIILEGKYFSSFLVVIQAPPFVFEAKDLYFIESKNVKSFFSAKWSGFTSFIIKVSFILGKISFILIDFF